MKKMAPKGKAEPVKRSSPKKKIQAEQPAAWRYWLLLAFWGTCAAVLVVRAVDLQVLQFHFLDHQGDIRNLRVQPLAAHRGIITDRNGKPLAVSTPVTTLWANPQELMANRGAWQRLQGNSVLSLQQLKEAVLPRQNREFIYLERRLPPSTAAKVLSLDIPGIYSLQESRRYYPAGAVTSQLVGITGVDGGGQEGIELAFNASLTGHPGKEKVIRGLHGNVVQVLDVKKPAKPGKDLRLSIDLRVQYAAFEALKKSVDRYAATSGSAVVLDAKTGEILAMVNQPSYNPNSREDLRPAAMRNRALTDAYEPGSSMKPFTVAAALESGLVTPDTIVNTNPGYIRLNGYTIRDDHDFGVLDVTGILTKSSNVGASKLALSLKAHALPQFFSDLGFGKTPAIRFPGVSDGALPFREHWSRAGRAALSYGYGISATTLQLAHAYSVIANEGMMVPLSLVRVDAAPNGHRVMSAKVANELVHMMTTVVSDEGTAPRAKVPGYKVAGKTGTARKASAGGYGNLYVGIFAGMAPVPNPRYVCVVMVNAPHRGSIFGGTVAAPVFSNVMSTLLRVRQVKPHHPDQLYAVNNVEENRS